MRSTKSFLLKNYAGLFLLAVGSSLALALSIAGFQLKSVHEIYLERISRIVSIHTNEILNELALEDRQSLADHLEVIRSQLEVDSLELDGDTGPLVEGPVVVNDPKGPRQNSKALLALAGFMGLEPFETLLSDGFDTWTVKLKVDYLSSYLKYFVQPFALSTTTIFLVFVASVGLVFFLLFKKIDRHLIAPLKSATSALTGNNMEELKAATSEGLGEIQAFTEASRRLNQMERAIAVSQLAEQVAHDIRSPLAALQVVEGELSLLADDKRKLLRHAISRIRDIASNLVVARNQGAFPKDRQSLRSMNLALAPQYIFGLIESIWSEKITQYRSREDLEFVTNLGNGAEGILARVNPVEFKRIVSNLVDNSVEAMGTQGGQVSIFLGGHDMELIVEVSDTGKGIPAEILPRLGTRGATFGKIQGSGLGLYHARTHAEKWGGKFEVKSTVGLGTTIRISLPLCNLPRIFVSEINLVNKSNIIVVDDDFTIHELWKTRLSAGLKNQKDGMFRLFKSSIEFEEWIKTTGKNLKAENTIFLMDYELSSDGPTGLDLIEQFQLQTHSILVTGRADSLQVATRSACLGVPLISKSNLPLLPVVWQESNRSVIAGDQINQKPQVWNPFQETPQS